LNGCLYLKPGMEQTETERNHSEYKKEYKKILASTSRSTKINKEYFYSDLLGSKIN
jgi:hypothetical protein